MWINFRRISEKIEFQYSSRYTFQYDHFSHRQIAIWPWSKNEQFNYHWYFNKIRNVSKIRDYLWLHCWQAKHSKWYTLLLARITISNAGITLVHAAQRPVFPNNLKKRIKKKHLKMYDDGGECQMNGGIIKFQWRKNRKALCVRTARVTDLR